MQLLNQVNAVAEHTPTDQSRDGRIQQLNPRIEEDERGLAGQMGTMFHQNAEETTRLRNQLAAVAMEGRSIQVGVEATRTHSNTPLQERARQRDTVDEMIPQYQQDVQPNDLAAQVAQADLDNHGQHYMSS